LEVQTEKYLVLCVDRDNDLGEKARVNTPLFGRDQVVDAATKLALADPEEADANALFAAVKKYDELQKEKLNCEIAVVCGDDEGGYRADRKVRAQVDSLLKQLNFVGIIFVSDGGDDEHVIPILQNMRPIVSVERVTVKHSQTVEETYLVLGRYLRMLIFDTRYSRWALGVPGVLLLLAGILIISGRIFEAQLATLLIVGGAFFVRGFNVDRAVAGLLSRGPYGYIRVFSDVSASILMLAGLTSGYDFMVTKAGPTITAVSANPGLFLNYGAELVGYFINGALLIIWVGIAVGAAGTLLSNIARDSPRWRREAFVLVMLVLLYFPVNTFSLFLIGGTGPSTILLVSYILVGLAAIFGLTVFIYPRVRIRPTQERE
jgi:putative membrane protein